MSNYDKTAELTPQNPRAYSNRGVAYTDEGNYDQAISDFNRVIALDPSDDAGAYCNRFLITTELLRLIRHSLSRKKSENLRGRPNVSAPKKVTAERYKKRATVNCL
jgi:lipoprotein NlpI